MNYFRCSACGHVWAIPKNAPDAEPTSITGDGNARSSRKGNLPLLIVGRHSRKITERPELSLIAEREFLLQETRELNRWVFAMLAKPTDQRRFKTATHQKQRQRMRTLRAEILRYRSRLRTANASTETAHAR